MWLGVSRVIFVTEEACLKAGGHCYERTGSVLTSNPPQYEERCKHCNKGRVAIPRDSFEYRDVPAP